MAIDRNPRQQQQASASAVVIANNSDDKMKASSLFFHSRNSHSRTNDDSESSALSAAGALLELGATAGGEISNNNKKVHRAKTIDDTLRHPYGRYRRNANIIALYRPILPRHPSEVSDDEADDDDENRSTHPRSSSIRVPSTIQVHFHNYNTAGHHQRSPTISSCVPGDIGNINLTVASPGWIGKPLGPPPRLPFGSRNRNRPMRNLGPIPNGSPIYSSNSNKKKRPPMNGIHISH
jgi:hypothetical protein